MPAALPCSMCATDMSDLKRSFVQTLLRGAAWLTIVIAVFSFWFGGRLIAALAKTDRILGEMIAIGIALVCGAVGAILQVCQKPLEERDADSSR